MKKRVLVPIMIALALLVVASTLFGISIAINSQNSNIIINEYVVSEFSNINIDVSTSDVEFALSTDGTNKIVCQEKEKQYHAVVVDNNTLSINSVDKREWYEHFSFFDFSKCKVTLYLDALQYDNLYIDCATGDIKVANEFVFENVEINLATGDIAFLGDVNDKMIINASTGNINIDSECSDIYITSATGNITLSNTICKNKIKIDVSTGNVTLNDSDANELDINTSTGSVIATLLSDKQFIVTTSIGKIICPPSVQGAGLCKVNTSTGDIIITINK